MSEIKETEKKSLVERILDGAKGIINKVRINNKINRSFDSARDSADEQLDSKDHQIEEAREALVEAAKTSESLDSHINKILKLQQDRAGIVETQILLKSERKALLEVK